MKKLLIATAAMAVVAGAQAQSSVTVYGVLDAGVKEQTTSARANSDVAAAGDRVVTNATGVATNSQATSRIGIKGTEDLGGGLKANFVAEFKFNPANGDLNTATSAANSRQTYAGVESATLGSLNFGRQITVLHDVFAGNDAGGANNIVGNAYAGSVFTAATAQGSASTAGSIARGYDVFLDGLASYTSPTIAGLTVKAQAGRNNNAVDGNGTTTAGGVSTSTQVLGGSVSYTYGKLNLAAARLNSNAQTTAQAGTNKQTTVFGANYDFGVAKVFAQSLKYQTFSNQTQLQTLSDKFTQFGVSAPINAKVAVFASRFSGSGETSVNTAAYDTKGYQAGATYALSKRTNAYLIHGKTEVDVVANAEGLVAKATAVGIRHTF